MNIKIRKANAADAAILALLARISFEQAFGCVWDKDVLKNYLSKTFCVQKMKQSIEKENNIFWIAFADELPVGYAKLKKYSPYEKLHDPRPAQLQKIYLLTDFTRIGIGEKMQDALFNEVALNGIETLWLAVWDKNDKAVQFYERHGFEKTTTYHYDYEKMSFDYFVMTKEFRA